MIKISAVAPPRDALEVLAEQVSPALADYRLGVGHVSLGEEFRKPVPVVTEVLQRWIIPRGSFLGQLDEVLQHGGRWHLQISWKKKPKYCARAFYAGPTPEKPDEKPRWAIEWFSGHRLAASVHTGLAWLEDNAASLNLEGKVRFVSTRLYKFSSLWLYPANEHLVVSAFDHDFDANHPFLPLRRMMPQAELSERLLEHFKRSRGRGRIR